ncbi:MAG: sensor histidine kinase [Bradymonadaceae bacterium]
MGPKTRRRGFPGGLRAQLLVGLGALLLTAFALVSTAFFQIHNRQLHQAGLEQVTQLAKLLGSLDEDEALRAAERLQESGALSGFAFLDDTGAIRRQTPSQDVDIATLTGHPSHISATRALEPPRSGTVVVAMPTSSVQRKLDEQRGLSMLYMLVNVLFILVVGYAFFTYLILRPIRAIGVATVRAAKGDLASPITLLPSNEFGQVGHSFNAMLERLEENRMTLEERLGALQKAHADLEQTQGSLVRSEKLASVGQLAAGVAHEVGNPLAALLGYADLLRDPDTDAQMTKEILDRVHPQLERIQTIIRQLLDYSRDDTEQPVEPTSLKVSLDEALALMRTHLLSKAIEIETHVVEDTPEVMAVHSGIVQVLLNLFINAADAMTEHGTKSPRVTIEIPASSDDEAHVVVLVRDNGPGIPNALAERIFDPFFTTKDPGHGTGLGLSICLSIMKRFGGDLLLESSSAAGTCFCLRFRAAETVNEAVESGCHNPSEALS